MAVVRREWQWEAIESRFPDPASVTAAEFADFLREPGVQPMLKNLARDSAYRCGIDWKTEGGTVESEAWNLLWLVLHSETYRAKARRRSSLPTAMHSLVYDWCRTYSRSSDCLSNTPLTMTHRDRRRLRSVRLLASRMHSETGHEPNPHDVVARWNEERRQAAGPGQVPEVATIDDLVEVSVASVNPAESEAASIPAGSARVHSYTPPDAQEMLNGILARCSDPLDRDVVRCWLAPTLKNKDARSAAAVAKRLSLQVGVVSVIIAQAAGLLHEFLTTHEQDDWLPGEFGGGTSMLG